MSSLSVRLVSAVTFGSVEEAVGSIVRNITKVGASVGGGEGDSVIRAGTGAAVGDPVVAEVNEAMNRGTSELLAGTTK